MGYMKISVWSTIDFCGPMKGQLDNWDCDDDRILADTFVQYAEHII